MAKKIVILGKFDGVHIGHMSLVSKARELSRSNNMQIIAYVIGLSAGNVITSDKEKEKILKESGIHKVMFNDLNPEFRSMSPHEFVNEIIADKLDSKYVVVGSNFRFGRDRCGDAISLTELCLEKGIEVHVVDTVKQIGKSGALEDVSSTAIKRYISEGEMEYVQKYLGRPFSIRGVVSEGKKLGRKLGFPTIHIVPKKEFTDIKKGVYATNITIEGKKYQSVTNVGTNPTVDKRQELITETHIPDCSIDCYGKTAELEFIKFMRSEKCFSDAHELANQLVLDTEEAKKFWSGR
jgi:riboflavin kinase/FMN adenylyltransferase